MNTAEENCAFVRSLLRRKQPLFAVVIEMAIANRLREIGEETCATTT